MITPPPEYAHAWKAVMSPFGSLIPAPKMVWG